MLRPTLLILLVCATTACSGGADAPTSPSSPTAPAPAPGGQGVQGQTVSALTGAAAGSLSVVMGAHRAVTSDANGMFTIAGASAGSYTTSVQGSSFVDRATTVSATADRMRLSMIPTSFDLAAFDEMFRHESARLQRWTFRPALVVVATTMAFRSTSDEQFTAASEQMTDAEVAQMVADITQGLALLTGHTFTSFSSVDVERPAAGARVQTTRNGTIVAGRYSGLATIINTVGYGRWANLADGTVVAGAMFLDRDFDRGDRRHLLRMHELGHALGYQHVRSRTSLMNPAVGPEATDFDRDGAIVAFQRAPGNRAPDIDPASGARASVVSSGGGTWSAPTVCR